jgi:hypothetical protein
MDAFAYLMIKARLDYYEDMLSPKKRKWETVLPWMRREKRGSRPKQAAAEPACKCSVGLPMEKAHD